MTPFNPDWTELLNSHDNTEVKNLMLHALNGLSTDTRQRLLALLFKHSTSNLISGFCCWNSISAIEAKQMILDSIDEMFTPAVLTEFDRQIKAKQQ